jgi:hypothetical protein
MESAEMISALIDPRREKAPSGAKRRLNTAVFPEAVGPKRTRTGIGGIQDAKFRPRRTADIRLVLNTEFDLFGEYLPGGKRDHLAIVFFNLRVFEHGKLVRPAGSGGGNFVHVVVVFD